jgi:hypothetical protein
MKTSAGLQSISMSVGNGGGNTSPTMEPPAVAFTKMTSDSYKDYLLAHNFWVRDCIEQEALEHDRAVRRRFLERFKETAHVAGGDKDTTPGHRDLPEVLQAGFPNTIQVTVERKQPHEPKISTKPHHAEKRANKRQLAAAREKAAALMVKGQQAVIEKVQQVKLDNLLAVAELEAKLPLQKAEDTVAKQAVERAKMYNRGDFDEVANVDVDHWKLVTRKKGSFTPVLSIVDEVKKEGRKQVSVHHDPSTPSNLVLRQAFRNPNTVPANS